MVSKVKTDMPCCYQHKTLNITGNGTKTISKSGRRKAKVNARLSAARAGASERVCECQKKTKTVGGQSTKAHRNEMKGSDTDEMKDPETE